MKLVLPFLFLSTLPMLAQVHLPPMEVSARGGVVVFMMGDDADNNYDYVAPSWQGELRWNMSQYLSLGAFATKSSGKVGFQPDNGSVKHFTGSSHYAFGGSLRLSTGRKPRVRPFVELSVGKFGITLDPGTKLKNTGSFVGYSFGMMIKISKNMYVVFPQLVFRSRKTYFDVEKASNYLFGKFSTINEAYGGLIINFGKR